MREEAGHLAQGSGVDGDAGEFHVCKHLDKRHLDVSEELTQAFLLMKPRLKHLPQLKCDVCILAGIVANVDRVEVCHRLAFRHDVVVVYGAVAEECLRHVVHVVSELRLKQIMGYHRVEELPLHFDAVFREYLDVVLHVLPDLGNGSVLKNGTHRLCHLAHFSRHRDIPRLSRRNGEAHSHEFCLDAAL